MQPAENVSILANNQPPVSNVDPWQALSEQKKALGPKVKTQYNALVGIHSSIASAIRLFDSAVLRGLEDRMDGLMDLLWKRAAIVAEQA